MHPSSASAPLPCTLCRGGDKFACRRRGASAGWRGAAGAPRPTVVVVARITPAHLVLVAYHGLSSASFPIAPSCLCGERVSGAARTPSSRAARRRRMTRGLSTAGARARRPLKLFGPVVLGACNRGINLGKVSFFWAPDFTHRVLGRFARLVKTQCSCSSGFSIEWRPWIGSSVKYDCSLVTRGAVRFLTKIFKRITTWKRSSSLIGLEGTVRMLWFEAPFEKIDMQRGGVKLASTDTEAMHTAEGQQQPHLRQWSCS